MTITSSSSLADPRSPINWNISGGTGMFTGATGSVTTSTTYTNPTSTTEIATTTGNGTITLAGGNGVTVQPSSLQVQTASGTPASTFLALNNQGATSVNYTAAVDQPATTPWLTLSTTSGTIQPGAVATLPVTVNPGKLALGVYQGQLDLNISGGVVQVPVTLLVGKNGAKLGLSQTGLQFLADAGGPSPAAQTITVANTEIGNLSGLTVATSVTGSSSNWLKAVIAPGFANQTTASVSITATPGTLEPGTYSGQVIFTMPSAYNSPQSATVQMVVSTAFPTFEPPAVMAQVPFDSYSGQVTGQLPGPTTVVITNPTPKDLNFTVGPVMLATTTFINVPFFNLTVTSGVVPAGGTAQIPISVNAACFTMPMCLYDVQTSPQTFDGWTISFPAINFAYIYWANLVPVGPSSATPIPSWGTPPQGLNFPTSGTTPAKRNGERAHAASADTCTPSVLNGDFTSLAPSGFQATVGDPTPLAVTIFDNCGNSLNTGSVVASFSDGDTQVPLLALGGGQWAATWVPSKSASHTTMSIQAVSSTGLSGVGFVPAAVAKNTTTPMVNSGGVTNAASGAHIIAPGAFISIYGVNMASGMTLAPSTPLPDTLGSAQGFLGGEALPLQFSGANQINAVVPFDVSVNTSQQIVIQAGDALSQPVSVDIVTAVPGVFTQNQSGSGPGAILVQPAGSTKTAMNTAANPAHAGDALLIFCTGLGTVTPKVTAGSVAPSSPPAKIDNDLSVTVGGHDAQVLFAGLAPGFVGLYQVNVTVPSGIAASDDVPVLMMEAGATSAPVTIALK